MNSELVYRLIAALTALLLLMGCGGSGKELERAAVSGMVTLDDAPLSKGVIRFVPADGATGPQTSVSIVDGRFEADDETGPIPGDHRIEIESTDDGGYAMDDEAALARLNELKSAGRKPPKIEAVRIPAVYNTKTRLKESVTRDGPNEFTFKLSSKTESGR